MHKLITKSGTAIYQPNWLNKTVSKKYFLILQKELIWQQETIILFGKKIKCPRLTAWYGDAGIKYRYSKLEHEAHGWPFILKEIKDQLNREFGTHFNSVLCNLYRDGKDSVGWHADNEIELGENPTIASISLGATRKFQLKHRETKKIISIELEAGSLLMMSESLQHNWLHSLPKQASCTSPRINLTYRRIINRAEE